MNPPEPVAPLPQWLRPVSATLIALGAAYVVFAIRLLWLYRETVVHGDFWFMYDHLLGRPFPENVLRPENSHSMIVPKLLWLLNFWLFGGSETSHYLLTLLLMGIAAWLLIRISAGAPGLGQGEKALFITSSLLAVFWLAKLQILISAGYSVTCTLPIIGLALVVLAIVRPDQPPNCAPHWWLGLAGCLLASFSFGTGLAIWPATLVLLWWRNRRWREVLVASVAMILTAGFLFKVCVQWLPASDRPAPTIVPLQNLKHWLMLLGSPVGNTWAALTHSTLVSHPLALIAGAGGLLLAAWQAWQIWRRPEKPSLPEWAALALLLFAANATALIALGRASFFRWFGEDPFSSRYLCWSTFFWLGLLWLWPKGGKFGPLQRNIVCCGLAAAALLAVWPAQLRIIPAYAGRRAESEYGAGRLAAGVPLWTAKPIFTFPENAASLDRMLKVRGFCYYARPAYAAVGKPLAAAWTVRSGALPATFAPRKTYPTSSHGGRGVQLSGWLLAPPADAIVLTDEQQIICGAGPFAGLWQPFSRAERNHFEAFAPALPPGRQYRVWAVRGQECQEIVPAFQNPAALRK